MTRFGLLAMIFCLILILGAGFGNGVNAQCKSSATTVGIGGPGYGPYDACDSYVKNTLVGEVIANIGYDPIKPTLWADHVEYGREFYADNYPYGENTVTWWLDGPVWTKENHTIVIDFQPGGLKSKTWSGTNTSYTVQYYATQGQ
jgi:hypothetical protein